MTMRPPRITAGLSAKFQDDLLAHQRPLPPPPPPPNTAAHAGDDQIAALEARLSDRGYRAIASADEIANRELDLESLARDRHDLTLKPVGRGRFHNHEESFDVDIAPDGSVAIHDAPLIKFEGLMIRFDVTDMIMRARGEDPYARAKLHFLDRTRDERAELGRRNRAELLSRSLVQVRAQIDRLWAVTPDPAGRREGLFELWDDCAEVGDAELVAGAVAARRFVIGVIRGRLRGTDAYTDDELARLNARRRSTGRFAPYDEAPAD